MSKQADADERVKEVNTDIASTYCYNLKFTNILLCCSLVAHAVIPVSVLPSSAAVVLLATIIVYCGSYRSVKPTAPTEAITQKDAMQYPIFGSAVLFSLFLVLKLVPKYYINVVLTGYFCVVGIAALGATALPVLEVNVVKKLVLPPSIQNKSCKIVIPAIKYLLSSEVKIEMSYEEIISGLFALPILVWYVITRNWIANNLIGVSFSVQAIEHISIGSFKIGFILLCGLFFYDIFWVFCTPVMVTVAKGLNIPIKLLFPRLPGEPMSLLGLGDIVIPGIFVALLLRFDEDMAAHEVQRKGTYKERLYFHSAIVGYLLGISLTIMVMLFFKAAQPALLYIVPCVILVPLGTAFVHNEHSKLFSYSEGEDGVVNIKDGETETKKTK